MVLCLVPFVLYTNSSLLNLVKDHVKALEEETGLHIELTRQ